MTNNNNNNNNNNTEKENQTNNDKSNNDDKPSTVHDDDDDDNGDDSDSILSDCSFYKSTPIKKAVKNNNISLKKSNDEDDSSDASSSSDSDDDAFCFKRQKFDQKGKVRKNNNNDVEQKRRKNNSNANIKSKRKRRKYDIDVSSSGSGSGSEDENNNDISKKLASLAQKRQNKNQKTISSTNNNDNLYILDSDDSDNDEGDNNNKVVVLVENTKQDMESKITSNNSIAKSAPLALSDDSDDDDDDTIDYLPNLSPTAKAALEKANKANKLLEEARKVTVDSNNQPVNDDYDDVTTSEYTSTFQSISKVAQNPIVPSIPITGPMINIKLRTYIKSAPSTFNKQSLHNKETTFRFRNGTTLQKVLEKYQLLHPITKYSTVKFKFDGEVLNLNNTLASYDMEDQDLLDVILDIPNNAEANMKKAQNSNLIVSQNSKSTIPFNNNNPESVTINARIKGGDPEKIIHRFKLKAVDPFNKLLTAYRKDKGYSSHRIVFLEYNNVRIEGEQTPMDLGLSDGCIIEICDETERVKQVNRLSKSATKSSSLGDVAVSATTISELIPRGGIALKVRINGDDKSIFSYGIMMNAPFQTLMEKVCITNKVEEKDCKFQFDGQALNPRGTPEDEDLEGGEMIEVRIDPNAMEAGKSERANMVATNGSRPSGASDTRCIPQAGTRNIQTIEFPNKYTASGKTITVLVLRNNVQARTRKFKVTDNMVLLTLKLGYLNLHGKKGCKSVTFYHNKRPLTDFSKSFADLGIRDMDILAAMENGKDFRDS